MYVLKPFRAEGQIELTNWQLYSQLLEMVKTTIKGRQLECKNINNHVHESSTITTENGFQCESEICDSKF